MLAITVRRKRHDDLRDQDETCCPNRVARLTKLAGIKALIGYKHRTVSYGGKPSIVVDNTLARQFEVDTPDRVWVTDITYIKTSEGFAYLAVIIDLYSRKVGGWGRQTTNMVLQALLMAVWRRKPRNKMLIHSPSRHLLRNCLSGNGPRFTVHQHRLDLIPEAEQPRTLHEPQRKLS